MKIVFLGCGYLGYNLSEAIKNSYETEVWGLDSPYSSLSTCFKNVDVFNFDMIEKMDLEDAVIIDTVSLVSNLAVTDNEIEYLENLSYKYKNLFELLLRKKIQTYYFVSSGGTVYGESAEPTKETHQLLPKTLYAKSKVMLENLLEKSNLNYVILRLSNPYGGFQATDKKQGVIPILIEKVLKGNEFELWGECSTVRDYIYIDDFSSLLKILINNDTENEIINIGFGSGHSLQEVFDLIEEHTLKEVKIKKVDSSVPIIKSIILDISKLKKLTNYEMKTTLNEGIRREILRIQEEIK